MTNTRNQQNNYSIKTSLIIHLQNVEVDSVDIVCGFQKINVFVLLRNRTKKIYRRLDFGNKLVGVTTRNYFYKIK